MKACVGKPLAFNCGEQQSRMLCDILVRQAVHILGYISVFRGKSPFWVSMSSTASVGTVVGGKFLIFAGILKSPGSLCRMYFTEF